MARLVLLLVAVLLATVLVSAQFVDPFDPRPRPTYPKTRTNPNDPFDPRPLPELPTRRQNPNDPFDPRPYEQSDFAISASLIAKLALPYIVSGAKKYIKQYVNNNWDQAELSDVECRRVINRALREGHRCGARYLRKLSRKYEQPTEQADIKFGKIFKKALGIAKTLGKAYITSQTGIPLADSEIEWKDVLKTALPYLKEGIKQYINNNWDEESDLLTVPRGI